ncbi:DUF6345 domain-containing protein [Truepera radiovictrix]|uniref:Uncharacterized protein n=1 Tax=Truepera radiovictrix (strain DSM 17093 / CIP 108686 / LMG 22925 / RQ-24) TaxID=649638 RepID=D7CUS6_TRURR|nr:DUF6345 domain-containing protein [Truepera radiovictrix]ADI14067.1 hypothetical protein Trad_0935 [Truepera radiovictrix DSM 17093]WMT57371.1 DUF6345 domain-containing protein [Truepera radiovictrix]
MNARIGYRQRTLVPLTLLALAACTNTPPTELAAQNTRELPVFVLQDSGVGAEQVQRLLEGVGVTAKISQADPSAPISYLDKARFMAVPSRTVARGTSKEGEGPVIRQVLDLEALKRRRPLPAQDALGRALEALRGAGMLPDTVSKYVRAEPRAEYSTFEATDRKGNVLARVNLDTHVLFDLRLSVADGVRLTGPGAKVKLVFGPSGRATQLYYGLYGLEEAGSVAVLGAQDAQEACAKALSRGAQVNPERVTTELLYYVPNAQGKLGSVKVTPSYLCESRVTLGDRTLDSRSVLIDAATGKPRFNARPAPGRPAPQIAQNTPSQNTLEPQRLGRVDAGTEYVGVSQGLGGSQANAGGFTNTMNARGVPVQFHWGDFSAWESDFKDPSRGGNDRAYVDDVDITFYTGHADGNGFTFPGANDDGFLEYTDAVWGERDLEWLVIAACGPLQETEGGLSHVQRWGPAFRGLHQMLAYATVSFDNTSEGRILAENLLGIRILWFDLGAKMVRQAWVEAATQTQPSSVTWAIMGPFGPGYTHNYNDFFWGKGSTSGDIGSPIGFWRVSGPS